MSAPVGCPGCGATTPRHVLEHYVRSWHGAKRADGSVVAEVVVVCCRCAARLRVVDGYALERSLV